METAPNYETEKAIRAAAFSSVIERAVQPVLDLETNRTKLIYNNANKIAGTRIRIGAGEISFDQFKPGSSVGGVGGIRNVTHAATVTENHSFLGNQVRSAVFGLTEAGTIRRHMTFGPDPIFAVRSQREVDLVEADALVEFLTSPHLNLSKLETILRLTPEDEETLAEQKQRLDQITNERQQAEAKNQRARNITSRAINWLSLSSKGQ